MSAIVINHEESKYELKFKKAAVWFSRIEHSLYAVVFILVLGAIYLDYDSRLEVKIVIMAIVALVFIVLFIKNINVWRDNRFLLEKSGEEFVVNKAGKVNRIEMSNIIMKKTVSIYSARPYFDIYLRIDGRKLSVIEGVSVRDKEIILKDLGVFISSFSKPELK